MPVDAIEHRVATGVFCMKTNPVLMRYVKNCTFNIFYPLHYLFALFVKSSAGFAKTVSSNVIELCLVIIFCKICLLLSGDIELNPGPNPNESSHTCSLDASVSILHHNIRSLRNKIDDIVSIVDEYDIVCFTETHLDHTITNDNIVLPGFNPVPFRLDRNSRGGGIILYYKDHISISHRSDLQVNGVEAMWFEIKTKVGNLLLNVIYRSQIEAGPNFWNLYNQMVSNALDYSGKLITLGDFNIDFLGRLPVDVEDIINLFGLQNKIYDPTRYGHNSFSLLDPILVTDSVSVLESNTIPIDRTISDHDPTYIVVDCGFKSGKSFKRKVWLYNRANWELFRDRVSDTDWNDIINQQATVDEACVHFTGTFMNIAQECIPTNMVTIRQNDKIWMTSELRREMRVRDRLRKISMKNKTPVKERKYKQQRNKVNNLKKIAKAEFYVSIDDSLPDLKQSNSKQYWKIMKLLLKGEGCNNDFPPMRSPTDANPTTFDNAQKGNLLNDYFCSISDLHDDDIPLPDFDDRGGNVLSSIPVILQDIIDVLSLLNPNKAVGHDSISNRMLKEVRNEVAYPISLLLKRSFDEKKFPKTWKLAHVIPVFKSGDRTLVSNYRPIALLCTLSKVFEKNSL